MILSCLPVWHRGLRVLPIPGVPECAREPSRRRPVERGFSVVLSSKRGRGGPSVHVSPGRTGSAEAPPETPSVAPSGTSLEPPARIPPQAPARENQSRCCPSIHRRSLANVFLSLTGKWTLVSNFLHIFDLCHLFETCVDSMSVPNIVCFSLVCVD